MINARDVSSAWKGVPWPRVFAQEIVADGLFLRSALIRKDLLPRYAPRMPLTWTIAGEEDCQAGGAARGPLSEDGVFYEEGLVPEAGGLEQRVWYTVLCGHDLQKKRIKRREPATSGRCGSPRAIPSLPLMQGTSSICDF